MNDPQGPPRNGANFTALTPLHFLPRTAEIWPNRVAIIHGDLRRTWADTCSRCLRLCSALMKRGIRRGDSVAVLLNNTPEHIEAHFGIPMCGAVMTPLNYRLDARMLSFMLGHSESKILIVDREYSKVANDALNLLPGDKRPLVVDVDDPLCKENGPRIGAMTYEDLLAEGDPNAAWAPPQDAAPRRTRRGCCCTIAART